MSLVAYKSSAGSGKTTTLVIEYLALALKKPKQFRQIIALTFTIKATNEMKERLIKNLVQLKEIDPNNINSDIDYLVDSLCEKTGFDIPTIKKQSETLLYNILHQYSDFGFSTIDSFVVKIVRSFANDLQLASNFEIELDKNVLIDYAIEQLYEQVGKDKELTQFLIDFTLTQLEDEKSTNLDEPLSKLGALIFDSKHYKNIDLLQSIPLKNFAEIRKILQTSLSVYDKQLENFGQEGLNCIESHGLSKMDFSRGWLHSYFTHLASTSEYAYNIDKLENKTFVEHIEGYKDWYAKKQSQNIKDKIDAAKPELSQIINNARAYYSKQLPVYLAHSMIFKKLTPLSLIHELKKIIEEYSSENDIIHLSEVNRKISEVVNGQHAPFIYERIGQRYNHFLIDEFQDTSVIQWNNILPLVENSLASGYRNLLVGDSKQSIYRWRDGEVEQFENLPELSGSEQSELQASREVLIKQMYQEVVLDYNYRSLENIIYFNNTLFSNLLPSEADYVKRFFRNHIQKTHRKAYQGSVCLTYFDDKREKLLQGIYEQIIELTTHHNYKPGEICILARKNNFLTELADFLIEKNLKVVSSDALFLYKSKSVNLIINFMELIRGNNISCNAYSISRYLSEEQEFESQNTFFDARTFFKYLKKQGYDFDEEEMRNMDAFALVEYIIRQAKISDASNPFLLSFIDLIIEQGKKSGSNVNQFLEYWDDNRKNLKIDLTGDDESVQLFSIHKAKGLEFPAVIFPLVGFDSELGGRDNLWEEPDESLKQWIPKVLIGDEHKGLRSIYAQSLEEERERKKLDELNMIYVASTRPTEQLFLYFNNEKTSKAYWEKMKGIQWEDERISFEEENSIRIGDQPKRQIEKEEINDSLEINEYISSNWRKRIQLKKDFQAKPSFLEKMQKGTQLHELLSMINTSTPIEAFINQAVESNSLNTDYAIEFTNILSHLLKNKLTAAFFNPAHTHFSEKEIINPNGEIFRPDKVIFTENEVWIIDYKYADYNNISDYEKNKHLKQVGKYAELVQKMEKLPTKGFLIYLENKIQLVEQ